MSYKDKSAHAHLSEVEEILLAADSTIQFRRYYKGYVIGYVMTITLGSFMFGAYCV